MASLGHQPIQFNRNRLGQVIQENVRQLTAQRLMGNAGMVLSQEYHYDQAGNLVLRDDSVFGAERFNYDPLGRIVSHIDPQGKVKQYLYDPAGDLLKVRKATSGPESEWSREAEYEQTFYRFDRVGNLVERKGEKYCDYYALTFLC